MDTQKQGKSKLTVIPKGYDWGLYFWRKPDGHLFSDGQGNLLNIPAFKGDIAAIAEIRKVATFHGEPEGSPWFYAGISRVSDETYSEQKDRFMNGLIPNLNDLGAVYDAQQGIKQWGEDG